MKRLLLVIATCILCIFNAHANDKIKNECASALLFDANTGKILYSHNPEKSHSPASLAKMMTAYVIFDFLERGEGLSLDDIISIKESDLPEEKNIISLRAYLDNVEGDINITLHEAINALIVLSANDVANALARHLGNDSMEKFVDYMNGETKYLKMHDTHFVNPSGLHDDAQVTNAYDLAKLSIYLRRDFPQYYKYFSEKSCIIMKKKFSGHNSMLNKYSHVDGIKTGYTIKSGYNMISSYSSHDGVIMGVVMGAKTEDDRHDIMVELLSIAAPEICIEDSIFLQPKKRRFI